MYTVLGSASDLTKVFLNEMLARGALVIRSPWSQDFGRKLIGAGLLSGALVSKCHTCVKLAVSEQHWWCMAQCEEITIAMKLIAILSSCLGQPLLRRIPREVRFERSDGRYCVFSPGNVWLAWVVCFPFGVWLAFLGLILAESSRIRL